MVDEKTFAALGNKKTEFDKLETFTVEGSNLVEVTLTSDEVTSLCPVTGQPDYYTVEVTYMPSKGVCIESKTFKLLMHSLRNQGRFCESTATHILKIVSQAIDPHKCKVVVIQKPRGGVSIRAVAQV